MPNEKYNRPSRSFDEHFFPSRSRSNAFGENRVFPEGTGSAQTQLSIFGPTENTGALNSITEQDRARLELDEQLNALEAYFSIPNSSNNQNSDDEAGEVEVRTGRASPRCSIS